MNNRVLFAVMCILFSSIGVPCFMQGDTKKGIIRIVLAIVTCNIIGLINAIMGIIMGIQILRMTDEEYEAKKGTFNKGIPA